VCLCLWMIFGSLLLCLAAAEGSTLVLHDNDHYQSDKRLHPKLQLKSRCVCVCAHMCVLLYCKIFLVIPKSYPNHIQYASIV